MPRRRTYNSERNRLFNDIRRQQPDLSIEDARDLANDLTSMDNNENMDDIFDYPAERQPRLLESKTDIKQLDTVLTNVNEQNTLDENRAFITRNIRRIKGQSEFSNLPLQELANNIVDTISSNGQRQLESKSADILIDILDKHIPGGGSNTRSRKGLLKQIIKFGYKNLGKILGTAAIASSAALGSYFNNQEETTETPTTQTPKTQAPKTQAPTTEAPTQAPTTQAPTQATTRSSTTQAPATQSTTTQAPTTRKVDSIIDKIKEEDEEEKGELPDKNRQFYPQIIYPDDEILESTKTKVLQNQFNLAKFDWINPNNIGGNNENNDNPLYKLNNTEIAVRYMNWKEEVMEKENEYLKQLPPGISRDFFKQFPSSFLNSPEKQPTRLDWLNKNPWQSPSYDSPYNDMTRVDQINPFKNNTILYGVVP